MKFEQKLEKCFVGYAKSTRRNYSKWPERLIRFHRQKYSQWIEPKQMEQWHIDEYLAQLVRGGEIEYSDSTVNQAACSLKIFFEYIGNPVNVTTVSTGHNYAPIVTISPGQAAGIIAAVPDIYRPVIEAIYYDFADTKTACKLAINPYHNVPVRVETINKHINKAAKKSEITKPVSIRVLRQSGIVHQLKDTNDPAGVAKKCGLKKNSESFRRYMRAAGMLGPVGRPKKYHSTPTSK